MNMKLKGFTLAEMLVSLLIVSIIVAAIMPTVVKNIKAERDHIWHWTADNNNSIFFNKQGTGSSGGFTTAAERQKNIDFFNDNNKPELRNAVGSVFVGLDVVPRYLADNCGSTNCITYRPEHESYDPSSQTKGNKKGEAPTLNGTFVIYTHTQLPHPLQQSHIDLFEHTGTDELFYNGRIAADDTNLAFGIGTLHDIELKRVIIKDKNPDGTPVIGPDGKEVTHKIYRSPDFNTAIGQYSMFTNVTGMGNTALGYYSLFKNFSGNKNIAVGSQAGLNLEGEDNVIIGANTGNSSITEGSRNTLIGTDTCTTLYGKGNRNICIGYNASGNEDFNIDSPNNTEKYLTIKSSDRLFIGSSPYGSSYTPLISGHTNFRFRTTNPAAPGAFDDGYDKDINFNLKDFNINTFNGDRTMFRYTAKRGDGYGTENEYYGETEANYYLEKSSSSSAPDMITGYKLYVDPASKNTINVKLQSKSDENKGYLWLNGGGFKINIDDNAEVNLTDSGVFKLETTTSAGTGKIDYSSNGSRFEFYRSETAPDPLHPTEFIFQAKYGMSLTANSEIYAYARGIEYTSNENKINISGKKTSPAADDKTAVSFNKILSVINSSNNAIITIDGDSGSLSVASSNNLKKITLMNTGTITAYDLSSSGMSSVCGGYSLFSACANYLRSSIPSEPYSDIRLKNISGDNITGLDEINKLEIKKFTYKNDKKKTPHVGVIAQDIQKIFPNSVFKGEDGYLKIKTEEIFYAAINAIKQLYAKLQTLTKKAENTDKKVTLLENETQTIKAQSDDIEKRLKMLEAKSERK